MPDIRKALAVSILAHGKTGVMEADGGAPLMRTLDID
jgi:hypothetical protein